LQERNYQGWVTLDFDAPRPGEGRTAEEKLRINKKYLVDELHVKLQRQPS
jgi:hypothetical protein